MPQQGQVPGVGGEEDERFLRRYRAFAQVWRVVLPVLIIAVALGIVGTGPLSWAEAQEGDLEVSYERFARRGAPWTLAVSVPAPSDGALHVVINRAFHGTQKLSSVTPQPTSVTVSEDVVTYVFEAGDTTGRLEVDFHFIADSVGWEEAEVGIAGAGPRVSFRQFMYP